jgi:hypothetical protein
MTHIIVVHGMFQNPRCREKVGVGAVVERGPRG